MVPQPFARECSKLGVREAAAFDRRSARLSATFILPLLLDFDPIDWPVPENPLYQTKWNMAAANPPARTLTQFAPHEIASEAFKDTLARTVEHLTRAVSVQVCRDSTNESKSL